MKLPAGNRAIVELAKIERYALAPEHEEGKHKARVFAAALGLGREHSGWLRERLLDAARTRDCIATGTTRFGTRYAIDFLLNHAGRSAMLRSCWIVRVEEDFPRLTTCYVL